MSASADRLEAERDVARAERDAARADRAYLRARVAAQADVLRDLLACPRCGGTAWVDWTDDHPGGFCADCTKGDNMTTETLPKENSR